MTRLLDPLRFSCGLSMKNRFVLAPLTNQQSHEDGRLSDEEFHTRLGVAGKIRTPQEAEATLEAGVDWIMLGRAAMLQHDFPNRYKADPSFKPVKPPVTRAYLSQEGLSKKFQDYIRPRWSEFFADEG